MGAVAMLHQDTVPEANQQPIGFTHQATLDQPYIVSLDGETIYHFNSEASFLEIASVYNPKEILENIPLPMKEGHSFIAFSEHQSDGFLIYETGKLSIEEHADGDIRWSDDTLKVIDLVGKSVKSIHGIEPPFELNSIAHIYHHDPFKFLAKLSIRQGVPLGEVSEKWAIYDFRTCEQGPEAVILLATTDQSGHLHLDVNEKPAYILASRSYTSYDGSSSNRWEERVFKIDEEGETFKVQPSPIYELISGEERTLHIHDIAFNGDLYGSQREAVLVESGDASWRPMVIRRLESGYAAPEILESSGPCEYYSIVQNSHSVLAFVEENISPEGVFDSKFSVVPTCEQDPVSRQAAILFDTLANIRKGFSDDDSPREREIIDLNLNLGDEPFKYYSGDTPEVPPQAKLLVFSRKKANPDQIEGSIHSIRERSENRVVRFLS